MVRILDSFWDGLFSGAMLVSRTVTILIINMQHDRADIGQHATLSCLRWLKRNETHVPQMVVKNTITMVESVKNHPKKQTQANNNP